MPKSSRTSPEVELIPGQVWWANLSPTTGREQSGHRPVLVIASPGYLAAATTLVIVVPLTSVGRGWPNHVPVTGPSGLESESWIMTEQPRTLSRERLSKQSGQIDHSCLAQVRVWLRDFLDL